MTEYDLVDLQWVSLERIRVADGYQTDLGEHVYLEAQSNESPELHCYLSGITTDSEDGFIGNCAVTWQAVIPLEAYDSMIALRVLQDMRRALCSECALSGDTHESSYELTFRQTSSSYAALAFTTLTSLVIGAKNG